MTVIDVMERLKLNKLHFSMTTARDDAVMFHIAVPGERLELEVFADGHLELERFTASSSVDGLDETGLNALISQFADEQ